MFNYYRKAREAQFQWIRNHPIQYVVLNATVLAGWIGYMNYLDRKTAREIAEEIEREEV